MSRQARRSRGSTRPTSSVPTCPAVSLSQRGRARRRRRWCFSIHDATFAARARSQGHAETDVQLSQVLDPLHAPVGVQTLLHPPGALQVTALHAGLELVQLRHIFVALFLLIVVLLHEDAPVHSTVHADPAAQLIVAGSQTDPLEQRTTQSRPAGQVTLPVALITQVPPSHPPVQAPGHAASMGASNAASPASPPSFDSDESPPPSLPLLPPLPLALDVPVPLLEPPSSPLLLDPLPLPLASAVLAPFSITNASSRSAGHATSPAAASVNPTTSRGRAPMRSS